MAAKFIPPGIVSLTRSADVAFSFIWQVVFLDVPINLFSAVGLSLVATSMTFLSVRQVITEKYRDQKPPNKVIAVILFLSR